MSHYFEERPAGRSSEAVVAVDVAGARFSLRTDRGVFSRGRLDPGTEVLLRHTPDPPPTGELLDLGCGSGAIALTLAQRSSGATVVALDVNERARELCAANAAENGLGNVTVSAPDDIDDALRFDAIWSNPPVRVGKRALHDLLRTWLPRLRPGAAAHLVVQRHLGADSLQRWLDGEGWATTRVASSKGYRVIRVERPTPSEPGGERQ